MEITLRVKRLQKQTVVFASDIVRKCDGVLYCKKQTGSIGPVWLSGARQFTLMPTH